MGEERRGDWQHGVDENLAMLNSAQRSTDNELDQHDLTIESHKRIILGDPENGKIGMSAQLDAHENLVNELRAEIRTIRATLYGDHTGHPGHDQRIERLEDKKEGVARRAERREGYFWHFITAMALQVLFWAGTLVLNWDRVEEFYVRHLRRQPAHKAQPAKPRKPRKQKPKPIVKPEVNADPSDIAVP